MRPSLDTTGQAIRCSAHQSAEAGRGDRRQQDGLPSASNTQTFESAVAGERTVNFNYETCV